MKLTKTEMLEKLNAGATLVQKFDRMYGKYFWMNDVDGNCIWNLNKQHIASVIKICKKQMIDCNTFEFTIK